MKRLIKALGVLLVAYIMLTALVAFFQRSLIYVPPHVAPVLAQQGLPEFNEVVYQTADGLAQTAWYAKASAGKPTLVIFHGNGGDLSQRAVFGRYMHQQGYGVLLTSYRGYPPNPGKPVEVDIYADTLVARAWLNKNDVADEQLVIVGASLGSGPATWLASRMAEEGKPARAVVLEVPLSTMADAAQFHYWYIPAKPLLIDRFDNLGRIAGIKAPLLVLAAEHDDVVPNKFAKKLFDAALEPKQYVMVPGTLHNTVLADNHDNFALVARFLDKLK